MNLFCNWSIITAKTIIVPIITFCQNELTPWSIIPLLNTPITNAPIIVPPIEEQQQIEDFLDKQTTQFDELIAKSKAQVTLLEEKRQALITATVTGKIDVRK